MKAVIFVVVQEGSSTGEQYVHTFDTKTDAKKFRRRCRAYRTTEPIEMPTDTDIDALMQVLDAAVALVISPLFPGLATSVR